MLHFQEATHFWHTPFPCIIDYPLLPPPPPRHSSHYSRPTLSLTRLPLLGLFTIYSTPLLHLSLLLPAHLSFPSLPSHLSNTEVIVSRKITADKSCFFFSFIFSLLHCLRLPNSYTYTLNLKLYNNGGQISSMICPFPHSPADPHRLG